MKRIASVLIAVTVVAATVFIQACSGSSDPKPTNVIEDADGVKADLDWSTGGSVNDALSDADLDLKIYKDGSKVLSSEHFSSFERITFDSKLYADGNYTVSVYLYSTKKSVNYTLTFNGVKVAAPYTFTSTFASTDSNHNVDVLTLKKEGKKFTITPIN